MTENSYADGDARPSRYDSVPAPGELHVVALIGDDSFLGSIPLSELDAVMDAYERGRGLTKADRKSAARQTSLRVEVSYDLRAATGDGEPGGELASACLWLALRHHSSSDALREGVDTLGTEGGVVLTCLIGDAMTGRPETAWAFMVGDRVQDGRKALEAREPSTVEESPEDDAP